MIKAVKFELRLGESRFAFVKSNRTEASEIVNFGIFAIALAEDMTDGDIRGVDGKNDRRVGVVVERLESRRGKKCGLEVLLGSLLLWALFERILLAG